MLTHDEVFYRFVVGLFAVLMLFGAGMVAVVLFGDPSLAGKMLSAFVSMFAGVLGLGSGYLLGSRTPPVAAPES